MDNVSAGPESVTNEAHNLFYGPHQCPHIAGQVGWRWGFVSAQGLTDPGEWEGGGNLSKCHWFPNISSTHPVPCMSSSGEIMLPAAAGYREDVYSWAPVTCAPPSAAAHRIISGVQAFL